VRPWLDNAPARAGAQSSDFFMNCVQADSFLTLHYRLSAVDGADFINTFDDKPATLSLGTGELSAGLEAKLVGLSEGTRASWTLPEGEAFGPHNPELLQWVARRLIDQLGGADQRYSVGDVVQFPAPGGGPNMAGLLREVSADGQSLCFDFNHPLAGQAVRFEVQLIGVL
jgi:FKBP-type peptidyl-prolyl cis-trans isomerase SlpA